MAPDSITSPEHHEIIAGDEHKDLRLDQFASMMLGGITRSQLKSRLLRITLKGKEVKPSFLVRPGDCFQVLLEPPPAMDLEPEDMKLEILYQDDQVVVVNKPSGMVVHPGAGNPGHTLVNGLMHLFPELKTALSQDTMTAPENQSPQLSDIDETDEDEGPELSGNLPSRTALVTRPGIVHRLDKDTSGVIITARNPEALGFLSGQFQERKARKWYLALASGEFAHDSVRVEGFICRDPSMRQRFVWDASKGKSGDSSFHVLGKNKRFTLFIVRPRTGRTHQIRVHARHLGFPLAGDPVYGRNTAFDRESRLMLHALALEIYLPGSGNAMRFFAPVPPDFQAVLDQAGLGDLTRDLGPSVLDRFP